MALLLGRVSRHLSNLFDAPRRARADFSAACYIHGLELLRATGRPQGLLASSWGGTPIEAWSSPVALATCPKVSGLASALEVEADAGLEAGVTMGASALWNAMVVPLLRLPITGALWYQGEVCRCDSPPS